MQREYWYSRLLFERALAAIYLVAFAVAVNQFVPLVGSHGLLPAVRFIEAVPFSEAPSLSYLSSSDAAFRAAAWTGVALAALTLAGLPQRAGAAPAALVWGAMWLLYLSFVNVGQVFYAFGWESLLLETGFFAMFLGGRGDAPSTALLWLWRWTLFRLMFGAGLIKIRGDACWRDLTCLDHYFETQPMPNPLSWYFHWLPHGVHRAGVVFNHVAELAVPFAYFAPQPYAARAALVTILFQAGLIVSGNLSWLNWLTIVLAVPAMDDHALAFLRRLPGVPSATPPLAPPSPFRRASTWILVAIVALLSVAPVVNMLSAEQIMNTSFNPIHLVNTYGAFGSITRTRDEIVIEGTDDEDVTEGTVWRAYEFRGKPGDPARRPPQVAPYHLRLDWLMWFAAMSAPEEHPWFPVLLARLFEGDRDVLGLLRTNPFPARPPRQLRVVIYRYRFTTFEERSVSGRFWNRERLRYAIFRSHTTTQR